MFTQARRLDVMSVYRKLHSSVLINSLVSEIAVNRALTLSA